VNNLICFLKTNKTILIIINNKVFDESQKLENKESQLFMRG